MQSAELVVVVLLSARVSSTTVWLRGTRPLRYKRGLSEASGRLEGGGRLLRAGMGRPLRERPRTKARGGRARVSQRACTQRAFAWAKQHVWGHSSPSPHPHPAIEEDPTLDPTAPEEELSRFSRKGVCSAARKTQDGFGLGIIAGHSGHSAQLLTPLVSHTATTGRSTAGSV